MEYRQDLIERINKLPIPDDFKNYQCGVIPMRGGVILQRVKSGGQRKTAGGLIIVENDQSSEPVGRIIAVGPEVSPYLKVGLLVTYNIMANMETFINGERMILVDQSSVFHIIADREAYVTIAPESPEQKRKREKLEKQTATIKRVLEKEANDEDKYEEGLKKRAKKSPKKKVTSKK